MVATQPYKLKRRVDAIRRGYLQGRSLEDLAREYEVTIESVRRLVRGETYRDAGRIPPISDALYRTRRTGPLTTEEVRVAREMAWNGYTFAEIAYELERPYLQVYRAASGITYKALDKLYPPAGSFL